MIEQYKFTELYAHNKEQPIGDRILDALIPILHKNPGMRSRTIAKHLGMKLSHLSGAVCILTGQTLGSLQNQWRMYKALELLRTTDLPLYVIVRMCGYSQYKHLAKAMKRELKVTPFEYRNGYRRVIERPR